MARKKMNKEKTKQNIIDRATTTPGYSIDVESFHEKFKTVKDITEAAEFVRAEIIYY